MYDAQGLYHSSVTLAIHMSLVVFKSGETTAGGLEVFSRAGISGEDQQVVKTKQGVTPVRSTAQNQLREQLYPPNDHPVGGKS